MKPLDTSSPRSTYIGFIESLKRAYRLIKDADAALRSDPPTIGSEEAEAVERDADILVERAVSTLDLSEVPIGIHEDVGIQTALQLKEVLDRVRQPFLDAIPGPAAVQDWKRTNHELLSITPKPFTWKLRNTEIQIVEVLDGPRTGEFLFSPRTVDRAGEFYHTMRDLPYRSKATEGFYRFFASTPGGLVPADYPLTRWIERLPQVFKKNYASQAVWQWMGLVLSIVAILATILMASRGIRIVSRRLQGPLQEWLKLLVPITVALVLLAVHEFIQNGLNITGQTLYLVTHVFDTIVYVMAAWLVYNIFGALSETFIASPSIPKSGVDASLLRLGARVLSLILGVWIITVGIKQLGIDMFPLVAGLGVGGLAVALAARSTLENFMGTLNIYADRPVRVGDLCRYGEDPSPNWLRIGRIEEIGLRSTRIRGIDRTITTIPNAEFCNMHIVNLTKCDRMLFKKKIGLRLDTTPDQSRQVLAALREMLLADPRITDDPAARVRVCDYGPSSIDLDIVAYVNTVIWSDFLAIQEDLVLRIMDIIKEAGTALALPPRILYHRRDSGIDAPPQKAAENQVRE